MKSASGFQDLIVWQKAHESVLRVYAFTAVFPKEETYGLTSQFRRAVVSIAEGFAKKTKPDKLKYYNISQGSLQECKYYLLLAKDLKFNYDAGLENLLEEVSKLLNSYIRSINNSQ